MQGPVKHACTSVLSYLPHFEEETHILISSCFATLKTYQNIFSVLFLVWFTHRYIAGNHIALLKVTTSAFVKTIRN